MNSKHLPYLPVNLIIISIAVVFGYEFSDTPPTTSTQEQPIPPSSTFNNQSISILLDDFSLPPNRDESDSFFNRLDGNGGPLNNSIITWVMDMSQPELPQEIPGEGYG
jgi:hypothetical protein